MQTAPRNLPVPRFTILPRCRLSQTDIRSLGMLSRWRAQGGRDISQANASQVGQLQAPDRLRAMFQRVGPVIPVCMSIGIRAHAYSSKYDKNGSFQFTHRL